ncbi:MAG TPA: PilZ domain-containing protein [Bryobacteraceae bacterium]|nr:PilZ domain-containing protein [Bryobacteraceae bacterium]
MRQKNTMPEIERRSKRRYPLQLPIRYRTTSARLSVSGGGQTLNISSAGLLIASPQGVQAGLRLRLHVDWPWLLDGTTPLQLVAESRVVRANASQFAVELERYQFRTSKRQSAPVDPLIWAVTA